MEPYRRTAHTRFDIKFHLVWITKYRKKLLRGHVGLRPRQIVRTICAELEVEILKGHVGADHVHLFVSCPPHVSASDLVQRLKGKSSRELMQGYGHLSKQCWGRHLWARGSFVASSGNVTDEVIMEDIRTQEQAKADDDFRVEEPYLTEESGFQPTVEPTAFQAVVFQFEGRGAMRFVRVISVCMAFTATAGARRSAAQDGAWITFLSHRTGENVLYRMHPDGSDLQAIFGGELKDTPGLPGGMKWYRQPHWSRQSPDGAYFLSWAIDLGQPLKRYHMPPRFLLHLGRLDGGPTRLITPDSEEVFAWAPDSQRFVYMRSLLRHPATFDHPLPTRSELVIAALDCSGEQVILDRSGIWLPQDWSPDGKRMLVSYKTSQNPQKASYALFELDLDAAKVEMSRARSSPKAPGPKDEDGIPSGGGLRVVLPLTRRRVSIARYAPDGKSIAFVGSSLELEPLSDDLIDPARYASAFELRVLDLDGGNSRVLCREPDIFGGPICWSPDGRQILFARLNDKNTAIKSDRDRPGDILTIWSIGRDGTNLRRFTTGWCPDWRNQ